MTQEEPPTGSLQQRLAAVADRLAPAERHVAEYMRDNPYDVAFASAGEIGAIAGTSDATVVRTAKALGFSGLPELKRIVGSALAALGRPPDLLHRRIETVSGGADDTLDTVFTETSDVLAEARRTLSPDEFGRAATMLGEARTVSTFGVGPSGLVASYLALRLNRMGLAARAIEATGFRLADDLLQLGKDDVLVLFLPARLLADVEVALDRAEAVGARTVLVTAALVPVLGPRVDVALQTALSVSGVIREALVEVALVDALALQVAAGMEARAVSASEELGRLRDRLATTSSHHREG